MPPADDETPPTRPAETGPSPTEPAVSEARRVAAADAFWRFSLTTYALPGVAPACLAFQDDGGGDVNLLLFCLWTGRAAGRLPEDVLTTALTLSARWRSRAVAPLRALRRDLKGGIPGFDAEPLRAGVKRLELAAEEAQQRRIAPLACAAAPPPGEAAAEATLALYLAALAQTGAGGPGARDTAEAVRRLSAAQTVPLLES